MICVQNNSNELVEVIGKYISNDRVAEVKRGKSYSILADEVTDTADKEELSLSLHFVLDNSIKEVFVDFLEVERITGPVLAQTILQWLSTHGLSPTIMRGQCRGMCRKPTNTDKYLDYNSHHLLQPKAEVIRTCVYPIYKSKMFIY